MQSETRRLAFFESVLFIIVLAALAQKDIEDDIGRQRHNSQQSQGRRKKDRQYEEKKTRPNGCKLTQGLLDEQLRHLQTNQHATGQLTLQALLIKSKWRRKKAIEKMGRQLPREDELDPAKQDVLNLVEEY